MKESIKETDDKLRKEVTHENCPSLESEEPPFECPDCGKRYYCYYDGADCTCGKIGLCKDCAEEHDKLGH